MTCVIKGPSTKDNSLCSPSKMGTVRVEENKSIKQGGGGFFLED